MRFKIIERLLNNGYNPDLILDIGAYVGNWTNEILQIYPNSQYILFEAIPYNELLERYKTIPNVDVNITVLNNKNTTVDWYEARNSGDSMFKEKTHHFENIEVQKRESITLDSFFEKSDILKNFNNIFVKIDCQGAEIPILEGASSFYDKIDFIILEMPFFGQYNENVPSFAEHIAFMDRIGFVVFEIMEEHIIKNFCLQVDIMFIRKNHPFHEKVRHLLFQR